MAIDYKEVNIFVATLDKNLHHPGTMIMYGQNEDFAFDI